ncbi:hypothetical protein BU14_0393s0014 [Porphyra umbilicalis]|uniref:Nudix hydrolase domain-containing protein n=1 Tax=Porphyra umbilicalis TaxID=2786 RepID=A0A1X6NWP0_PORUM|nr:hypothetical protein BU14_0393s0014 [Porphyra umbilicalis]|eukprot:OSX72926.1 hypothetical protein BU14_0393s0014 [Porphyra umbilicalis]
MPSGIDVRSMIQGMQSRGATRESIRTMPLPPPARTPLNALTTSGGHPVGARLSNAAAVAPPIIPCTPLIAVGIMLDQTRRGPRREVVLPPRLRLEEQTSSSPCSPRTDRLTEGWWGVRSPTVAARPPPVDRPAADGGGGGGGGGGRATAAPTAAAGGGGRGRSGGGGGGVAPPPPRAAHDDGGTRARRRLGRPARRRRRRGRGGGAAPPPAPTFVVEAERVLFRRYQTVTERLVRYPSGRLVSFDIVGHAPADAAAGGGGNDSDGDVTAPPAFDGGGTAAAARAAVGAAKAASAAAAAALPACASVFVFPFDTATRTVTYIREYQPGPAAVMPGFPAGMYEAAKHGSLVDAAAAELEEEAHLAAGRFVPLLLHGAAYSRNRYSLFLALDPAPVASPAALDAEEYITIHTASLGAIRRMILGGEMSLPSSFVGLAALDYLRAAGYDTETV